MLRKKWLWNLIVINLVVGTSFFLGVLATHKYYDDWVTEMLHQIGIERPGHMSQSGGIEIPKREGQVYFIVVMSNDLRSDDPAKDYNRAKRGLSKDIDWLDVWSGNRYGYQGYIFKPLINLGEDAQKMPEMPYPEMPYKE